MKKMKTTIAATVALAACASTSLFAQNVKECTMTFALTVMQQASVSTTTAPNVGTWSADPTHYKTATTKLTQANLLKAIAIVMHNNAGYYTTQAKLVLAQSELGGFWNIDDALAQSYEDFNTDGSLSGTFNTDGTDTGTYSVTDVFFPAAYAGFPATIDTGLDLSGSTAIGYGSGDTYARLATGRHFLPMPVADASGNVGAYPVGHMQPWGQIFVKDPGHKDSAGNPLCENVTFFFYLQVQECYDCFYLSSFISDANFTFKAGAQVGPPCCTAPESLTGRGTDKYYLSLSFDNTINNSYLNPALYTNSVGTVSYYYEYSGHMGLVPTVGVADGTTPDLLPYVDSIKSGLGRPSVYETRFTLNGIVTYNWNLMFVNKSDLYADYVGTASYAANGYGFIGLVCSLLTGSANFSERVVKDVGCCDDIPWYASWYGTGSDDGYGINSFNDLRTGGQNLGSNITGGGYFDPEYDQWNLYPYYNIVGGATYPTGSGAQFTFALPDQNESPFNPAAALTQHQLSNPTAASH